MTTHLCLISGQFHRPPARQVLAVLASGTPLELVPEPDNPYDPQAIKVMCDLAGGALDGVLADPSTTAGFEQELLNCGMTLEMLVSAGPVQLGYIAASGGKPLARALAGGEPLVGNGIIFEDALAGTASATLCFAPDGSPRCQVTVPGES